MSVTRDQALALVHAMVKSPRVQSHLEGALGFDKVPAAKDFDSMDPDTLDKCEELCGHMEEIVGCLVATLRDRPRQGALPLGEGEARPKRRKAAEG